MTSVLRPHAICHTCSGCAPNYPACGILSISNILCLKIDPTPCIGIFGLGPDALRTTTILNHVTDFASLIAWRKIPLLWKRPQPPSIKAWLYDILFLLILEIIKFALESFTCTGGH